MAVEMFVARHGQNVDNANGILNGHRDLPLTELGLQQARELGAGILEAGLRFDTVFTSPLSRSHETAKTVCEVAGIAAQPVILPLMIEREFGIMTGQPISQIEPMCSPHIIKTDTITYFLDPEGAETFPQLVERGKQVLAAIRERQESGNALLVCHGDIGKMIYVAATDKNWEDVLRSFHFGNGDLIEISPNDDAHVIKLPQYNY